MNHEEFWAGLSNNSITFEERLEIVRTSEYDIRDECQPWCITQYFSDITNSDTPVEDAFKVAEALKERLGLFVIERESSYCSNKFMTIMDQFDSYITSDGTPFWIVMFRHAFKKTGFLYAKDVDPKVLYAMFADKDYHTFRDTPFIELFKPSPITQELVQYLHHPDRIGKWLEANPDKGLDCIEEYLN